MGWQSPFDITPYTEDVMLICMTTLRMPKGMQSLAVYAGLQTLRNTQLRLFAQCVGQTFPDVMGK